MHIVQSTGHVPGHTLMMAQHLQPAPTNDQTGRPEVSDMA